MSHATLTAAIEDWLIGKALADPDIRALFEKLCERLSAMGIPLHRAALSWPTLHPLFRAEQVFWYPDKGATLEQYTHDTKHNEKWLGSPFHHVHTKDLDHMRRRLVGPDAMLDFEILEHFRDLGYTDYLLTATEFRIANTQHFSGGSTGIMASWCTSREGGFSDNDMEALRRIQRVFAVACRASIQRRVMGNLTNTYVGPTAARQVLSGDIRRGDGERIKAVVWFSDLRSSTRLSDTMDPDSYLALLNKYFECTAGPVIDHGGEILNFIGDGVLAIFPIEADCPLYAVGQAEKAVLDAFARRDEVERTGTPGNAPIRFGIGLAIGEVMFGNIGVPQRLAFSGIGRVVNKVTRIETANKFMGTDVLAMKSFVDAATGDWVPAGQVEISDFDRHIDVYTLPEAARSAAPKQVIALDTDAGSETAPQTGTDAGPATTPAE